jgi:abortive infection bacteriophage resistance protein
MSSKPSRTIDEQIHLLQERGMKFHNLDDARHYLKYISYYRLKGYWWERSLSPVQRKKAFLIISCMVYLCDQVTPGHQVKDKIKELIQDNPNIPSYKLGFLNEWERQSFGCSRLSVILTENSAALSRKTKIFIRRPCTVILKPEDPFPTASWNVSLAF